MSESDQVRRRYGPVPTIDSRDEGWSDRPFVEFLRGIDSSSVTVKRFVVPSSGLSDEPRCSQAELSV